MDASSPSPVAPAAPATAVRRTRTRPAVHLALLAATFLTLAGCWSLVFEGVAPWRIDVGWPYAAAVLAILGAHEMGHYVACRIHGVRATLPFFIPGFPMGTFGAVIRIRERIPDRRALFDIAAAGPIAGFLVAIPILVHGVASAHWSPPPPVDAPAIPSLYFGDSLLVLALVRAMHPTPGSIAVGPTYVAAWLGLLVTSINLFPVGQLDGGHAAFALSRRLHRFLAWGTILSMVTWVAAYSILRWEPQPYLLWCVILLFLRARHPPLADPAVSLGRGRRWVAVALAALFVVTFMPVPLRFG